MMKILSFVGRKKSGKTTVLEKVVKELSDRGYSVAVVKHGSHTFEMDHEGKDTWRFRQAGAGTVAIMSADKFALITGHDEQDPKAVLARFIDTTDFILTEGFRRGPFAKIEVHRKAEGREPLLKPGEDRLVATVTDDDIESGLPVFGFDDSSDIADFVEEHFKNDYAEPTVELVVNGKVVPMKGFVQDVLKGATLGVVETLRGVDAEKIEDLWLRIRARRRK